MVKKLILPVIALLLVFGCGGVNKTVMNQPAQEIDKSDAIQVDAEAEVTPVPENLLVTKRDALDAAKRKAVENAVGVYVTGQMVVSKAVELESKIFSKTAGYIKDFKILEEGMNGPFYRTKITAWVKLGDVKKDLDALELKIKTEAGNPRIVVIIDESLNGSSNSDVSAETIIQGMLLEKGYKVVDQGQLDKIKEEDTLKAALKGDEKAAAAIGKRFSADVAIVGKALTTTKYETGDPYNGAWLATCNISTKVLKVSTGELLFAKPKIAKLWDITEGAAVAVTVDRAARDAGKDFVSDIAVKLADSNNLQLIVSPFSSLNKLDEFRKLLRSYENVREVNIRSFEGGEAELELGMIYGTAADFASRLSKAKNFNITVDEVGGHTIKATVK